MPNVSFSAVRRWGHLSRMYAVYRQAHTPTAVEFSAYCNFISSKEKNLVVAGTSQLFVYRIIHDVEVAISWLDFFIFIVKCNLKRLFCDMFHLCHYFRVQQKRIRPQVCPSFAQYKFYRWWIMWFLNAVHMLSNFFPLFPLSPDSKPRKEKLEQVASFSLFGNVMSMASVQLVGASRDALLLSFKDAKVSA